MVRLMNGIYNPGTFLKQLIPNISVGVDMRIKIGFSFLALQYGVKYSYFYAAEDLCTINKVFHKIKDVQDFADEIEKMTYEDFLEETFLKSKAGERFVDSGIHAFRLVANTIWIRK